MNDGKKTLFMLGAGFMQGVAIRTARDLGCTVIAADGNPHAVCAAEADRFVHIDLKDTDKLIDFARSLQKEGRLDAVFTAATDFSAAVAAVAEACGLPGHSLEAALNATDKVRMRSCFARRGVPSPVCTAVTAADLEAGVDFRQLPFPAVVKPADSMGARGCRIVRTPEEMQNAVHQALSYSRSGTALAETYIEGSEFSIEGLVYDGKVFVTALADRHIFFPPYFIEMGHTIPSCCSKELADEVITVFEQGVHALGLHWGAVKGDILVKDGKAFVGEIAARLSGGFMSGWTVPYSSGLDITRAALLLALGEKPNLGYGNAQSAAHEVPFAIPLAGVSPYYSAERAWISIPGRVASVSGLEAAAAAPLVKEVFPRAGAGDMVVFPQNNVEKCGNVITAAVSYTEAAEAAETAALHIVLRLEPHTDTTDTFLKGFSPSAAGQKQYPPNMVQLPESAWELFTEIPDAAAYTEAEGFFLPAFLANTLHTAFDVQGRSLKMILEQAVSLEPRLKALLCSPCSEGSGVQSHYSTAEKAVYWKALLRGGLQGVLYQYDCTVS